MQLKLVFVIIVGGIALILALQNPEPVNLKFLAWETPDISLAAVLIASTLVGALCGLILSWKGKHKPHPPKKQEPSETSGNEG